MEPKQNTITGEFAQDVEYTLRQLRGTVVEVLGTLGLDNERPQDVARQLGLHKSLAWKIAKIAQSTDPFSLYQHIPGSNGIQIFLEHAAERGVPNSVIDQVRMSIDELESLQEVHADDRATFELMLSSYVREGQQDALIAHRKQLFKGASSVWGIQARSEFLCYLVHPAEPGSTVCDVALIKGFVDLMRLRPDVEWCLCKSRWSTDDGETSDKTFNRIALHEDYRDQNVAPLLPDYCSQPLPELRRMKAGNGVINDELMEGPVGNTGSVTCVLGEYFPQVIDNRASPGNERGSWTMNIFTPVEWVVFDLIIHESFLSLMPPQLNMYSRLANEPARAQPIELPMTEKIEDLGQPALVQTPAVPNYREMVKDVTERMGWNANEMRGFRASVQYPPLSSAVQLKHGLLTG